MFHGTCTPEGYSGSLEAFYFSCDEQEFWTIVNLPDYAGATTVTLAGNASGTFSSALRNC